jgi:heme-degrading monooxygenase HmoA
MVVVLFGTRKRQGIDLEEYGARNERMYELVQQIPGFLGIKGYVSEDGDRISIARFESEEALSEWRFQPEHVETQRLAREKYYESYWVQVCKTIRDYRFSVQEGWVQNPTDSAPIQAT